MSQLGLPLYTPRDRGRLNALRSILAAVSDELRRQAPVAQGIVEFLVNQFPQILRQHASYELWSANPNAPQQVSPYVFDIHDLIQLPTGKTRPDVFSSVAELIELLDVLKLAEPLDHAELIGIDESQVDTPLAQSALAYLKSIAFRMYKWPDGTSDEAVGPILNEMRMQLNDDEVFDSENKLLGYIRNNYIAYISSLTALAHRRKPFTVLHGPLVRAIGGFSHLTFSFETAHDLFNIDMNDAGEFNIPLQAETPVVKGDNNTEFNLSFSPNEAVSGESNLRNFNNFCIQRCGRQCANSQTGIPKEAVPGEKVTIQMMQQRSYPGFCLYFWMLRSLFDLCRLSNTTVSSVIEDVSAATEMTRLIFPSLLSIGRARQQIENSSLKAALSAIGIKGFHQQSFSRPLYGQARQVVDKLRLSDSNIFSYVLSEGQYTSPVQIYRYRTRNTFDKVLGYARLGIRNELENILETLFPSEPIQSPITSHPGYRVLMSYMRTTPLREPIRLEYFDLPKFDNAAITGSIYLLSLPYQEYGIPIILYYADKLARTPTQLIRTIIEREYMELVLENRFHDPISIMRILGHLSRGYFQREGLR